MLFNEPKLLKLCVLIFDIRDRTIVSVLFNEPKLLKSKTAEEKRDAERSFSALQRAEIAEIWRGILQKRRRGEVSVLFNEPKLLKFFPNHTSNRPVPVSVLFNEPKLLKCLCSRLLTMCWRRFSALQRAEIAEIEYQLTLETKPSGCFSALQRAEIAEMPVMEDVFVFEFGFSALQRAEIAEIRPPAGVAVALRPFQCSSTSRNC